MTAERDGRQPVPGRIEGPPRLTWHASAPREVAAYWQADLGRGYSATEAAERLRSVGPNRLPEAPPPPLWRRLLNQVSDFTVLALLAAAAVAGLLAVIAPVPGESALARFGDSVAILVIVILNAALGLVQEARAERALEALRDLTAPTARVIRDGEPIDVAAFDLVPGDLLLLEDGDRIPADVRLVTTHELEIQEAALTGESVPVAKQAEALLERETPLAERRTMAFMGTQVSRGRGRGVVCNTGVHTELGQIAGMLAGVETERTPLEADLQRFGKRVVIACVAISGLVFAAGFLLGKHSLRELFLVAVALAVAAIPEGLPAVTTIVLALGTQRMAKRNALVRRLPAVETLGCTQVICTDKTGTLTQNAMSVRELWIGGVRYDVGGEGRTQEGAITCQGEDRPSDRHLALRAATHAGGARLTVADGGSLGVQGDPTDAALLVLAWKGGERAPGELVSEQPFTSERRMASVVVRDGGALRSYVRGAPEAVIDRARSFRKGGATVPLGLADREVILGEAAAWAARARRVIALAYKEGGDDPEGDLVFLALVGIIDPPRPEVKQAIAEARTAGIRTIMITGDHPLTGRAIAEEIGLWEEQALILTGQEIDGMDQQRLEQQVDRLRVVARATAEHKLRIVEALKARGFICAMTGDGVNDAPAVKSASIGVAMGRTGTDVTKEAADLVLADDNYATILAAVAEGRTIYSNIRKFVFFLLSSNAGCVLVVLVASLLGWDQPLAPIQILWINLITNGLPALALGVEGREPAQMAVPPRPPGGALLSGREYIEMFLVGVVMATAALAAFHYVRPEGLDRARTLAFAILAIAPLIHAFNCRSQTASVFRLGLFSNRPLWGAVLIGIALELMTIFVPALHPIFKTQAMDRQAIAWIIGAAVAMLGLGELFKLLQPRLWRRAA